MKRRFSAVLLFSLFSISLLWSQGIRKPVWAGQFYDENPERLSSLIDKFLQNVPSSPQSSRKVQALIVPHAGYIYSGQVAAYGYALVKGKDFESVIILGPSHRYGFRGCSIYHKGGFETPLGVAKVDEELAASLSRESGYTYVPDAHQEEHSLEVQVPFIQKTLPEAKIVPVVTGLMTKGDIEALATSLAKILSENKKVLLVVSTDMSHFLPKKSANSIDEDTLSLIQSLNTNSLIRKLEAGENILCGGTAVAVALLWLKKMGVPKVEILKYSDSSQAGGPESQVVGYGAAALYMNESSLNPSSTSFSLSSEEKEVLLKLARSAINEFVLGKKILKFETQDPNMLAERGAFVTLKLKGQLRGCIGFPEPVFPLFQAVIRGAIYAATEDPRFPPVVKDELKDLEIEISVLTPLNKIQDPKTVQVGKHGLVISQGNRRGLLLPQVPVENRWSRDTFLEQACLKAGLPPDAWKTGAEIYVFEAIVFH